MNEHELKGNWQELKGRIREQWGKLTDDDMLVIDGKREQLVGKLRQHYGHAESEAEQLVADFKATD
jgi:uncharacterized protein YjbJ (UPF0337 family)